MTSHPRPLVRRIIRAAVPLAIILPLALTTGCDDDDQADATGPATVPETTLSRDGWITTVNDLCVHLNEALGAIIGPLFASGPPAADEAQSALEEIVRRTRNITDEIDALSEPSSLTVHVAALVSALDAGSDQAEAIGGPAYFSSDVDPYRPAGDIAGELGLDACDTED